MTRTGLAAVVVLVTAASTREPTFSRVETYPDMGRFDYILAVADFNNDGRDDILAGGARKPSGMGRPKIGTIQRRSKSSSARRTVRSSMLPI